MALYTATVATGSFLMAGTMDNISITLVGERGESAKVPLNNFGRDFNACAVDKYNVTAEKDLGRILLIRLHKDPYSIFPEDSWFCDLVTVEHPGAEPCHFPCYRWIEGYKTVELREGAAKLIFEDSKPVLLEHRETELKSNREAFRWKPYTGSPWGLDVNTIDELNSDSKYSLTKISGLKLEGGAATLELKLKGMLSVKESWKNFEDMERVFWKHKSDTSEYVSKHWKEDAFFGYQFLNGANPVQIFKCVQIPPNFPVTDEMVKPSLGSQTSLHKELQKGNIYMVDYKVLDGMPANVIQGRQQYIAAPMCLLYKTPEDEVIPLAIQISQTPGPDNPIFLPSDSEWDWTLAKIWVRNADFLAHEGHSHFLGTHLFAEAFLVTTLRQLPACHPVYKLLFPHFRYTLNANMMARIDLLGAGGVFDQSSSVGAEQFPALMKRGLEAVTYTAMCAPDHLKSRGVEELPKYYFRDDIMKIWAATESFVSSIVECYYKSDDCVQKDSELKAWVSEIFTKCFHDRTSSGVPSVLKTRPELIKYLTMVIYTTSSKHASVNSPQFDFFHWMPNAPSSMRKPPPKTKGTATKESILETLPEVDSTCRIMILMWVLTRTSSDMVPLGHYPNRLFTEEKPTRCIEVFQKKLSEISAGIQKRNESMPAKYTYLDPSRVENSIPI
ncbi:hydroperoxide isomerase ALOXE3-like [Ambystoma mexicanum]|uniref:hydroperoxide isomerase ALOXE3-like n=1 Tax=Ambystoma mexicanum TaxID=8296 RepID=UPI0037E8213B